MKITKKKTPHRWGVALCMVLALTGAVVTVPMQAIAAQDAVVDYQYLPYSLVQARAFLQRVTGEQKEVLEALSKKYADKPQKVAKAPAAVAYAKIIAEAKSLLSQMETKDVVVDGDVEFMRLQRLHYSILADQGTGQVESRLKRGIAMMGNLLGEALSLDIPKVRDPDQVIGSAAGKKEAARLFRPVSKTPVPAAELANLTALEISRLQPIADHRALSGQEPGNNFEAFLKEQVSLIRACDKKLAQFDLVYARRIMFFDEIKNEATSPKITAKDRYGQTWKVKWGDEVHTDVAMTRVAIDLGASFVDLKFYSGPGETLLILDAPGKTGEGTVHTFTEMAEALLKSKFEFHAERYLLDGQLLKGVGDEIIGHGKVDQSMAERESIDPKYIGAAYVKFKECQLSLYNPAIKRLGGAALSNVGAIQDRVARSSIVFNTWVKNKDMKDDNSRVGLLFNPKTNQFDRTVEYQSDLGCTLGGLKPSGEMNSFESSFVRYAPGRICFAMRPLYVPDSWKACTWSDARWMALRIARLSRADLERSFSECGWPAFVQRLAVEKLISRRNELIEPFRLDLDGIKPLPCDANFTLRVRDATGDHIPVLNGKIQFGSPIVLELESRIHPEGLANVIPRKKD
ncbi:MAG: hypothetical protein WA705_03105 [Candidatus Ozemobacteraceae bacterium]